MIKYCTYIHTHIRNDLKKTNKQTNKGEVEHLAFNL